METLAAINAAIGAIEILIKLVQTLGDAASRNKELTPEERDAITKRIEDLKTAPHWQR